MHSFIIYQSVEGISKVYSMRFSGKEISKILGLEGRDWLNILFFEFIHQSNKYDSIEEVQINEILAWLGKTDWINTNLERQIRPVDISKLRNPKARHSQFHRNLLNLIIENVSLYSLKEYLMSLQAKGLSVDQGVLTATLREMVGIYSSNQLSLTNPGDINKSVLKIFWNSDRKLVYEEKKIIKLTNFQYQLRSFGYCVGLNYSMHMIGKSYKIPADFKFSDLKIQDLEAIQNQSCIFRLDSNPNFVTGIAVDTMHSRGEPVAFKVLLNRISGIEESDIIDLDMVKLPFSIGDEKATSKEQQSLDLKAPSLQMPLVAGTII